MKSELKTILQDILEMGKPEEETEEYRGTVSPETLDALKLKNIEIDDIRAEFASKKEELAKQFAEKGKKATDEQWAPIYAELSLDPDKVYRIDRNSGEVFECIPSEPDSESESEE